MAKPHRSCMARALAGTIAMLALPLSLPLMADADQDPVPLPAPPLHLDTVVKVPAPLLDTETLASSEATAVVEVPPAVEGPGVLEQLLPSEHFSEREHRGEPALEVPAVVSEPAEPIVPPPRHSPLRHPRLVSQSPARRPARGT